MENIIQEGVQTLQVNMYQYGRKVGLQQSDLDQN